MAAPGLTPYIMSGASILILIAGLYSFQLYRVSGNRAVLYLALALVFWALSFLIEAYVDYRVAIERPWGFTEERYMLDLLRAIFTSFTATLIALMFLESTGVESRWIKLGIPFVLLLGSLLYSVAVLELSGIRLASYRVFLAEAGINLGIIAPISFILGAYFISSIARPLGSRGAMTIGVGFVAIAILMPLMLVAYQTGSPAALAAWLLLDVVVPALLLVYGFHRMGREAA